jgi:hypothetical protein
MHRANAGLAASLSRSFRGVALAPIWIIDAGKV